MITNKELNAFIKAELLARVTPELAAIGFKPPSRTRRGKLPFRYWRDLGHRIDMLEYQWDKYNRPAFVINFRPVEDECDIAQLRADPADNWHHLYGGYFRAGGGRPLRSWFKLSILERLFWPQSRIPRLVENVRLRVPEIDRFLNGGPRSRYIRAVTLMFPREEWPEDFFRPPSRILES